jgi:signal recognition particle subunit SRP54
MDFGSMMKSMMGGGGGGMPDMSQMQGEYGSMGGTMLIGRGDEDDGRRRWWHAW